MRHGVDGKKFGKNSSHRKAMFANMAKALIQHARIVTTLQKAKEARRDVERLITIGKGENPLLVRRRLFDVLRDRNLVEEVVTNLAKRYESRDGGYTRVIRISQRRQGDGAELVYLELV